MWQHRARRCALEEVTELLLVKVEGQHITALALHSAAGHAQAAYQLSLLQYHDSNRRSLKELLKCMDNISLPCRIHV